MDLAPKQVQQYFTVEEQHGLETQNCGNIHDDSLEKKWLGQVQGHPTSMHSGPCCPNGHTYGWFGKPLLDTHPLKQVELSNGGHQMPPFQIRTLLEALQDVQHPSKKKTLTSSYDIFMVGDSTMRQTFFGFLCGLVRIGGNVTQCTTNIPGHYNHPLCQTTDNPVFNGNNLTDTLGNTLKFTQARIKIILNTSNTSTSPMVMTLRLYQPQPNADQKHFTDLFMNKNQSLPDLVLVIVGLHARTPEELNWQIFLHFQHVPTNVLKNTVFKSTTIPHFPDLNSTGSHELFQKQHNNTSIFNHCKDLIRPDNWRNRVANNFFRSKNQFWQGRHHLFNDTKNSSVIPVLDMTKSETHYYQTYGMINSNGNLDCVHHIYTPLYWDSFFLQLAMILYKQHQQ